MKNDSASIFQKSKIVPFLAILIFLPSSVILSDTLHYKNMLVGDRAATMGGTYVAISDDASGGFYNPAGLALSFGESVSGSGNAFHRSETSYKKTIGNQDWKRESEALLPNFFGMIKKFDKLTVGFAYVVPDTTIEHQEQEFINPLSSISKYYRSQNSEDVTYMMGPSAAMKLSENISVGVSLYYYYRNYRLLYDEFIVVNNASGDTESTYSSSRQKEHGLSPKLGVQWSPFDPISIGFTISKTALISSSYGNETIKKTTDSSTASFSSITSEVKRKFPTQLSVGVAYFPNPYFLVTADGDLYLPEYSDLRSVLNISFGTELFIDEGNAIRFGYFTNNTSKKKPTSSTAAPYEFIDLQGLTFGYSSYARSSTLTVGGIYTYGTGSAYVYEAGNTDARTITRNSLTLIFAANYNY